MSKKKTKIGILLQGIGKVAPDIIGAIGSLTGITALEKARDMLQGKTDLDPNLREYYLKALEVEISDLESARKYNTAIQESEFASNLAKYTPYIIDLFISFIWGGITLFIIAKAFGMASGIEADMSVIMGIYAAVTGQMTTVIGFHRGSSIGSKLKDMK